MYCTRSMYQIVECVYVLSYIEHVERSMPVGGGAESVDLQQPNPHKNNMSSNAHPSQRGFITVMSVQGLSVLPTTHLSPQEANHKITSDKQRSKKDTSF